MLTLESPAIMASFRKKLRLLIADSDLSQKEIAIRAHVDPSTISKWASGERRPYLNDAGKLARALGVSLDWLANDDLDWPPPDYGFSGGLGPFPLSPLAGSGGLGVDPNPEGEAGKPKKPLGRNR